MRYSIALVLAGILFAAPSTAAAQTIPGANTPFGGLERTLAGIDVINAQVANLRRQLAACDGPAGGTAVQIRTDLD